MHLLVSYRVLVECVDLLNKIQTRRIVVYFSSNGLGRFRFLCLVNRLVFSLYNAPNWYAVDMTLHAMVVDFSGCLALGSLATSTSHLSRSGCHLSVANIPRVPLGP